MILVSDALARIESAPGFGKHRTRIGFERKPDGIWTIIMTEEAASHPADQDRRFEPRDPATFEWDPDFMPDKFDTFCAELELAFPEIDDNMLNMQLEDDDLVVWRMT